ncbi:putative membrane protein [Anseongella ginsenosidimutans]|uniref:Putative membrane protein n=1 Tax=Anseongella ginsenosidimutans TaxID=496056 RepID=A0A4V2UUD2_9SPHI|nr:DUF420 domain-containing protein [Anseongella ginsenosidimutans]QEC51286.1 DUF420 domain-containing protein [Anseongella ginsenosidimutans]TCS90023.1 putative membrane protein [Anseongella ginsenosidimutans]
MITNDKLVFRIVLAVSLLVLATVVVLNRRLLPVPETFPSFIYLLPGLNAFINGTCCLLLLVSLYFIKRKNILMHKRINLTAFVLSALFLISYVTFHFYVPETKYPADNPFRPAYLVILISHIILAALVLPLVLLSFYHGLMGNISKHRKLVRWSYPIWLYVTMSGVAVYLLISPYYSF